jgi:hypothetical protein
MDSTGIHDKRRSGRASRNTPRFVGPYNTVTTGEYL